MSNHELGSAREAQAELEKKRLFLIYRDNELFQAQIAPIREALASSDYQVIEQNFPAETTEQEIATWAQSQADQLRGVRFLTDDTFARSVPHDLRNQLDIPYSAKLDEIMDQSAIRAVFGPGWAKHEKKTGERDLGEDVNLDEGKELFTAMGKRIFENPENIPESVLILSENMSDHHPFSEFRPQTSSFSAEKIADRKSAELVGQWLQELGIAQGQVKVESTYDQRENIGDKTWVISDRHNGDDDRVKGGVKLRMPLADFFQTTSKAGLLRIPMQELQQATADLVRERLAKGAI